MAPTLSIVIPIHNERAFLDQALERLRAELSTIETPLEIILAENGSTDGTGEAAEAAAADDERLRVLRLPEPNYGAAMRSGFQEAKGDWMVNFDIDYFSGDFLRAALAFSSKADVVVASKRVTGSDDRRGLMRRGGTFVFNMILKLLFRSRVSDTHGMKLVSRAVVEEIVPTVISTKDLFDTELVIRAERAGYRVAEVPAIVEELRDARSSFISRVPRTLAGVWRIRRQLWREERSGD